MKGSKPDHKSLDDDEVLLRVNHVRSFDNFLSHCDLSWHLTDFVRKTDLTQKAINAFHVDCVVREALLRLLGYYNDGSLVSPAVE